MDFIMIFDFRINQYPNKTFLEIEKKRPWKSQEAQHDFKSAPSAKKEKLIYR